MYICIRTFRYKTSRKIHNKDCLPIGKITVWLEMDVGRLSTFILF